MFSPDAYSSSTPSARVAPAPQPCAGSSGSVRGGGTRARVPRSGPLLPRQPITQRHGLADKQDLWSIAPNPSRKGKKGSGGGAFTTTASSSSPLSSAALQQHYSAAFGMSRDPGRKATARSLQHTSVDSSGGRSVEVAGRPAGGGGGRRSARTLRAGGTHAAPAHAPINRLDMLPSERVVDPVLGPTLAQVPLTPTLRVPVPPPRALSSPTLIRVYLQACRTVIPSVIPSSACMPANYCKCSCILVPPTTRTRFNVADDPCPPPTALVCLAEDGAYPIRGDGTLRGGVVSR